MTVLRMTELAYLIKKNMPVPVLEAARTFKGRLWNLFGYKCKNNVEIEYDLPWCSPDVWQKIVTFYLNIPKPIIFEYGTGAASIWHIRNLLTKGGTYIGVEHKQNWYIQVLDAVIRFAVSRGLSVKYIGEKPTTALDLSRSFYDSVLEVGGPKLPICKVKLKLRPPRTKRRDLEGTLEEFREYVEAVDEKCNVVIVDGRARKACVNYVLDNGFLRSSGLLVLFEAGRGIEGWLGSPALTGMSDYQPEVQRMLKRGGELVDGSGLDSWPDLKQRRTLGSNAYHYPTEACFLYL
jgi:hypothetical protein